MGRGGGGDQEGQTGGGVQVVRFGVCEAGGAVMNKKKSECPIRPTKAVGGQPMAVGG